MRVLIGLVLLLAAGVAGAQPPPNLVKNPGFEEVTAEDFAAHWRGGEFGKPGKNVTLDTAVARSGKNSVRLGVAAHSFVTCASEPIPCKPNTTYYVAWWCKTEKCAQARAYLFFQTNTGQRIFEDMNQFGTSDWTLRLGAYTTKEDETWLHPVLTTHGMGEVEDCRAWFDDIAIYEARWPEELEKEWAVRRRAQLGISETAIVLSRSPELTLWADDLAAKIYREDGLPSYARPAASVSVAAARREQEFFQVAVLPTADLGEVTLRPGPLTGPGTIPASAVRWWPVGYTKLQKAKRDEVRRGLTPDPLLDPQPVKAPAGQNTPFLVGLQVPPAAPAGNYTGQIALVAGEREVARLTVSLRVFDFELPVDPTFRTLITYTPASMSRWDKRPISEIEKEICQVLYEHRIRGSGATAVVPARIENEQVICDFTAFDARLEWLLGDLGFNAFFLGPMFGGGAGWGWEAAHKWLGTMMPLSPEFNRYFPQYLRQVSDHLQQKGWLDNAYLYLWDEPEPDYFDKVVELKKMALAVNPKFHIWGTTSPSHQAFWGVVNAWSVPFGRPYFNEEIVEQRRAAGDEIWVYNIPSTLERPNQVHRLWFWQAAYFNAVGTQLWQTTFYRNIDPWENITPEPFPTGRDKKGLYVYDAGEAVMLYPNPSLHQNPPQPGAPLSCLRLRLLHKGIDDYEYLHLLQQRLLARAKAQGAADPAAVARDRMREFASRLVLDISRWETNTVVLEEVRRRVGEEIEKL